MILISSFRPRQWACAISLLAAVSALLLPAPALTQPATAPGVAALPKLPSDAPLPEGLKLDTYRLWPGRAPGATSDSSDDTPTLTVFRPLRTRANGTAVVIAPGGAYIALSEPSEGQEPAAWFAGRGVTAFVLTYRVGDKAALPTPLLDGARAIRWVRSHAADFGIDPARIGMMGFSAGGHLAAVTGTLGNARVEGPADPVDGASSRPDFLILAYPWLEATQAGNGGLVYCELMARRSQPCNPSDLAALLPITAVSPETPPTFIFQTADDTVVPVGGVVRFYQALVAQKVPAELHVFETGAHGSGLGGANPALSQWPELLDGWLRQRGLLPARSR
jgi:acetyl esterase/lipase